MPRFTGYKLEKDIVAAQKISEFLSKVFLTFVDLASRHHLASVYSCSFTSFDELIPSKVKSLLRVSKFGHYSLLTLLLGAGQCSSAQTWVKTSQHKIFQNLPKKSRQKSLSQNCSGQ